ncbi:Translation initiation factor eIF-2B subunit beta [Porphyridium purpureum]|uniref:Translation initiation factor eIF2B subunit beta n=1 Tax=Porphyridium purpureum TaxID=35688 RepID=A0A5J4YWK3_PORPP|nr:Translation initiation factor eIF-2B subunit beta [Porphyridium purpureum]|eukprot:POR8918..scf209_3
MGPQDEGRAPVVALPSEVEAALEILAKQLRQEPLVQSSLVAMNTAKLLRTVVSKMAIQGMDVCLEAIRIVGRRLHRASELAFVVENTVRRVLRIAREEFQLALLRHQRERQSTEGLRTDESAVPVNIASEFAQLSTSDSFRRNLADIMDGDEMRQGVNTISAVCRSARKAMIEAVLEYENEIETTSDNIVEQALAHIHANEVILTYGWSVTVELFLLEAAKKRHFEVIVAEAAPSCKGQGLARKLASTAENGGSLDVTVIPDSAVFAIMSRVHKVVVGAHAVMANGALLTASGVHLMLGAAKMHAKPVIACAGMYKLTPLFPHDRIALNDLLSPESVASYAEVAHLDNVKVISPAFDVVPPEFVTLLITNTGGYNPSYIYRLLRDYYDDIDVQL